MQLCRMHIILNSSSNIVQKVPSWVPLCRNRRMYQERVIIHRETTTKWWLLVWSNFMVKCVTSYMSRLIPVANNPFWYRYGSWGVCFTYATFFATKGLAATGRTYANSVTIRKACSFLLAKQLSSGGWGENYISCETEVILLSNILLYCAV
jgi:hypothetical protein